MTMRRIWNALSFLLLWIVAPAAALGAAYHFQLGLVTVCIYAFLLVLIVSRAMVLFWTLPLRCERDVSRDVVNIGEPVSVTARIRNYALWPILWAFAEEIVPKQMPVEGTTRRLLFLPPGRSFHLYYRFIPTRRGCHQIGPVVLQSGDVFGLLKRCRVDRRRDFVTAVPPYRVIEEFRVGQRRILGDMPALRSIFEDTTRLRGIREYQRGDAMKRIHWRASARTGRLCSKVYDPVVEPGATVVLDFNEKSWKRTHRAYGATTPPPEMAVEAACSICRYLSDGGWKVGFFSNGRDPLGLPGVTMAQARATDSLGAALHAARMGKPDNRLEPICVRARRSADQFAIIHENLGRIALSDGLPIEQLLLEELAHIERQQVLVLITGEVSDSFISGVLRARELGYRIMLFVVCNPEAHNRAFEYLLGHNVEIFDLDHEGRLEEIATGRRFV